MSGGVESSVLFSNLITDFVQSKEKCSISDLSKKLIENGFFKTEEDIALFLFEALKHLVNTDDAFPIHYYSDEEEMPNEEKYMKQPESLTDDLIEADLKNN